MAALLSGEGFRFLFRTDKGEISRDTWWLGTALTGIVALVATILLLVIKPFAAASSDLSQRGLIDAGTLVFYLYLTFYAFLVMVTGICWYNLSAKRFRAQGLAPSLAGLPLVLALVDAAAHWMHPRVPEFVPLWSVYVLDAALVIVILWSLYQLGLRTAARS